MATGSCIQCGHFGVVRRGLCDAHYARWRRGQDLRVPVQFRVFGSDEDRLLAHSVVRSGPLTTPCRVWGATLYRDGYGQIDTRRAHRVAWEVWRGPCPDGLVADHLCRVRACIEPNHLDWVTSKENTARGEGVAAIHAKKTHCDAGHELRGVNVKVNDKGWRDCIPCARRRKQESRARQRAAHLARSR